MKSIKIAMAALALFVLTALPNQAKAFSVNNNDMYFVLSGNTTEYYVDMGAINTVLSGGYTQDISSMVNTSGVGSLSYASIIADNTNNVYFGNSYSTASALNATGLNNSAVDSGFSGWAVGNSDGSTSTTSMTNAGSNGNSWLTTMDGGATGAGVLNGGTPKGTSDLLLPGTGKSITFYLYYGDLTNLANNAIVNAENVIATITNVGGVYTLTLAVAAVPIPPSLVMFATGLIAVAMIARRRQLSA